MRHTRIQNKNPRSCPMLDNLDLIENLIGDSNVRSMNYMGNSSDGGYRSAKKLCVITPLKMA